MAMKPSTNIWIQCQQCPCGDWKCYIKYEGDDQTSLNSQQVKTETMSSTSLTEAVFTPYVGQIFKSDDEAFEYYSNFARKNSFSIRKARSTDSQNFGFIGGILFVIVLHLSTKKEGQCGASQGQQVSLMWMRCKTLFDKGNC